MTNQANTAVLTTSDTVRYDAARLTAIDGSTTNGTRPATLLPNVTYAIPSGVTVQGWGTRWGDMPYCYARGFVTGSQNTTLVILKYNVKTGELVERRDFAASASSTYHHVYRGRTYVGFLAFGTHPITGVASQRYFVRCNNVTGEIEVSAPSGDYPSSSDRVVGEDGNFRINFSNSIDFETGLNIETGLTVDNLDIPQWLYPENGIRPGVTEVSGVDTFDATLTNTYFSTIVATFNYEGEFVMLQNATACRYRGMALSAATATASEKTITPQPTVMYKFPTEIVKNDSQVLTITYELVIPAEIVDASKNFLW